MREGTGRRSSRVRVSWSRRSGVGFAPCRRRPRAACVADHHLCSAFRKIERRTGCWAFRLWPPNEGDSSFSLPRSNES
jgi:hypothetical protein